MATFIDDYSRLACVVPVKQKSEVSAEVICILTLLENQSDKRSKAMCTDRGSEYINSELQTYAKTRAWSITPQHLTLQSRMEWQSASTVP